jgi:hypothetical protein
VGVGREPVGHGDDQLAAGHRLQHLQHGGELAVGEVLQQLAAEDDVDGGHVVQQPLHPVADHPVVGAGGGVLAQRRVSSPSMPSAMLLAV